MKEWLWIFASTDFALFHAADTPSRAELENILGLKYSGLLSSDDYCVYNGYDVKAQQKCLAHLRRHFKKLIKLPGLNNHLLTVVQTCRRQERSVIEFFEQAIKAMANHDVQPPSLIPQVET